MGYQSPGVRTTIYRNARGVGGDTPYMIPVVIGEGDTIFSHRNIRLTYTGTDVTYIPTSSGLATVSPSEATQPHGIISIGKFADARNYVEGFDFVYVAPSMIHWLPTGKRPETGEAIYVSFRATMPKLPASDGMPLKFPYTLVPRGTLPMEDPQMLVAATWEKQITAHPAPSVRDAAIASAGSALYLYGGLSSTNVASDKFMRFLPATEAWISIGGATTGTKPPALAGASMAFAGDKLVLFGGTTNGTSMLADTYIYDSTTQVWSKPTLATAPPARVNHRMVAIDAKIYCIGGSTAFSTITPCSDVWCFDTVAGTWADVSPVGTSYPAVSAPVVEASDGKLYVFGGRTGATTYDGTLSVIDVSGAKAVVTAPTPTGLMPSVRAHAASGVVEGGLWVFGGNASAAAPKSDTWRYDIAGNAWKQFSLPGGAPARTGAASETLDGKVYVVGGAAGTVTNSDTWVLDPYLREVMQYLPSDTDYLPSETVVKVLDVQSYDGMKSYKEDVDWTFEAPNKLTWLTSNRPTPTDFEDLTTFYRVSYNALKTDSTQTDPFAPTLLADLDQIDLYLGDDFKANGKVNELKLAAQYMVRSGANLFYTLQVRPTGDDGKTVIPEVDYVTALERLETLDDAYTLVPLTENLVTLGSVLSHVQTMSSRENRKERKMFMSWQDPVQLETIRAFAKNTRDFRLSIIWPGMTSAVLSDGKTHVLPGYFLCAAVAGDEARGPMYRSQTNCNLTGIFKELLGPKWKTSQLDYLASAGVFICTQHGEGFPIYMRHALTTDMQLVLTKENSLINIADYYAKYFRQILKPYIGNTNIANSPELHARIRVACESAIEVLKREGNAMGGTVGSITNPADSPDTVLLTLNMLPPYPCNYINVSIYLQ